MSSTGVSPAQGQEPLASPSVTKASDHSLHRSRPVLFSQFRGPFVYNMAETEEERLKREEAERKAKEDEEKKSNFQKVKEAREAAEARATEAERKLKERVDADKKAAEEKLAAEKRFEELAQQREAEAAQARAEAAAEKAKREAAEAKVKEIEDQQEAELAELLKTIPEDKRPPLDASDPVAKRLAQVKYVISLLGSAKPEKPIGGGIRNQPEGGPERKQQLLNKPTSPTEAFELMGMSGNS